MAKRILIVDDDPNIRRLVSLVLTEEPPYIVNTVSSGEAALLSIARQPVDLLFTDLRMPGMNGIELVRRVRELDPHTAVIVFTINPNDLTPQQAQELKIDCLLEKPLSPDQLRLAVDLLLNPEHQHHQSTQQPTPSAISNRSTQPKPQSSTPPTLSVQPQTRATKPLSNNIPSKKPPTSPLAPTPMAVRITPSGHGNTSRSYSEYQLEAMHTALKELAAEPDVSCAVLANISGMVLTHWSRRQNINVTIVAALAAGNSLALTEIGRSMGQTHPSNLIIQEGHDYSILIVQMEGLILLMAIGSHVSLGWARIAIMRTCEEVLRIIQAN